MESDFGDLPFAVELKLQLSQLSFGQHEGLGIICPPSDFPELDILDDPVFLGRGSFGRNNLGEYPEENFGINCQQHGYEEARISDRMGVRLFNNDYSKIFFRADYSFARVYSEDAFNAEVAIFLNSNIFEKIYMAKNTVNFQLVTSFNEQKKFMKTSLKEKTKNQ